MAAGSPGAAKMVEATVAAGRSVLDATGKLCRQGETAQIDAGDVQRLRDQGFLAAKGEEVIISKAGPSFSASDGPRVTVA